MKVEYLANFSQYFENVTKAIIGSCNKTFVIKISKRLAEFDEVFKFEKFLIYVLARFKTLYVPVVFIFPNRKFKPKCLQW